METLCDDVLDRVFLFYRGHPLCLVSQRWSARVHLRHITLVGGLQVPDQPEFRVVATSGFAHILADLRAALVLPLLGPHVESLCVDETIEIRSGSEEPIPISACLDTYVGLFPGMPLLRHLRFAVGMCGCSETTALLLGKLRKLPSLTHLELDIFLSHFDHLCKSKTPVCVSKSAYVLEYALEGCQGPSLAQLVLRLVLDPFDHPIVEEHLVLMGSVLRTCSVLTELRIEISGPTPTQGINFSEPSLQALAQVVLAPALTTFMLKIRSRPLLPDPLRVYFVETLDPAVVAARDHLKHLGLDLGLHKCLMTALGQESSCLPIEPPLLTGWAHLHTLELQSGMFGRDLFGHALRPITDRLLGMPNLTRLGLWSFCTYFNQIVATLQELEECPRLRYIRLRVETYVDVESLAIEVPRLASLAYRRVEVHVKADHASLAILSPQTFQTFQGTLATFTTPVLRTTSRPSSSKPGDDQRRPFLKLTVFKTKRCGGEDITDRKLRELVQAWPPGVVEVL